MIPGKDFPYSDHEGVEATFQVDKKEDGERREGKALYSNYPQDEGTYVN